MQSIVVDDRDPRIDYTTAWYNNVQGQGTDYNQYVAGYLDSGRPVNLVQKGRFRCQETQMLASSLHSMVRLLLSCICDLYPDITGRYIYSSVWKHPTEQHCHFNLHRRPLRSRQLHERPF